MKKNILPEEKLLRLIRGPKKKDIAAQAKIPGAALQGIIGQFRLFFTPPKIILACLIASCIYLAFTLIYPLWGLRKIRLPQVTPQKITAPKEAARDEVKPFEFYQQEIKQKEIFSGQGQGTGQKPGSAADIDAIKDINLVGIISGDNPQAIIEDKKAQKNFYLSVGQSVGEVQIAEIQEGKIILLYRGQKYELYL